MKTKDVPAIVMLLAGCVYCLLGILYQIPFLEFAVQLLIVLLVFWIMGGIVRMVLDRFMGEIEEKAEEENEEEAEEKDAEGEAEGTTETDGGLESEEDVLEDDESI